MLVAPALQQQKNAGGIVLHSILLQVALAHALPSSCSPLAALPREVVHLQIARHVGELFLADLARQGLLTPVQMPEEGGGQPPKLARRESQLRTSLLAPTARRREDTGRKWAPPPRAPRPWHIAARPVNLLPTHPFSRGTQSPDARNY